MSYLKAKQDERGVLILLHSDKIISVYESLMKGAIQRFPLDTWTIERDAKSNLHILIRYLILDKYDWNRQEFCSNFCLRVIQDARLSTGFQKAYNRNIYPLVTEAFPEWNIQAWEMQKSRVPKGFWNTDTTIRATRWLIEEKLSWDLDKVQNEISDSAFLKNNLGGLLRTMKIGGAAAVQIAYPEYNWTYLIDRAGYKITKIQANEIRTLFASGEINQRQLAVQFDVSPATIHNIVHGAYFKTQND